MKTTLNIWTQAIVDDIGAKYFSPYLMDELKFLVQNETDFNLFYEVIYNQKTKTTLYFIITNLRQVKIQEINMTKRQFITLYKKDRIQALETLFQHKVLEWQLNYIPAHITAEDIYFLHKAYPRRRLMRFLNNIDAYKSELVAS